MPHERAFSAAILLLTGCSLKGGDPQSDAVTRRATTPPAMEDDPLIPVIHAEQMGTGVVSADTGI